MTAAAPGTTLGTASVDRIHAALGAGGLWLDVGAATLRVQSRSAVLAAQLQATYSAFPLVTEAPWADVHCRLEPARGLRRWVQPQVVFSSDGRVIFAPFPADSPLPLFEWGCNWLLGQRLSHLLLLHAGTLERDGRVLLLPATPGSGKSTLTAALAHRGWRLMSDEFGVFDPTTQRFRAMLKPVALKNESIAVIRHFAPEARLGPEFPKTRKGTVAHMVAPDNAVARRQDGAQAGAVVLPRWVAGSATTWMPLQPSDAFAALAFNAFNYQIGGEAAFHAVAHLARSSRCWQLTYSDLDDAIETLDELWAQHVERAP